MRIVVISPPSTDPREIPAMGGFFAAGLGRYHVRKPAWTERELEAWLGGLPAPWLPRLVLHGHPALVGRLGLGGRHDRDGAGPAAPGAVSRSCHGLPSLRRLLGTGGSVLFGPVFPSLSKPGYGPAPDFPWDELRAILTDGRRADDPGSPGRARVLAIGGVTAGGLGRCRELGFDGAAVLGAVWNGPDPAAAFAAVRDAAAGLEGARHAA
jgi:thiamine-phosphate pyrophosphorylase